MARLISCAESVVVLDVANEPCNVLFKRIEGFVLKKQDQSRQELINTVACHRRQDSNKVESVRPRIEERVLFPQSELVDATTSALLKLSELLKAVDEKVEPKEALKTFFKSLPESKETYAAKRRREFCERCTKGFERPVRRV